MTPEALHNSCLSFAGAEETFPFSSETSVFRVGGRMFALSQLGEESLRVSLKCDPRLAEALPEAHAAVIPGYHKQHWNTVILDGSRPGPAVQDMIEDPTTSSSASCRKRSAPPSAGAATRAMKLADPFPLRARNTTNNHYAAAGSLKNLCST